MTDEQKVIAAEILIDAIDVAIKDIAVELGQSTPTVDYADSELTSKIEQLFHDAVLPLFEGE